MPATDTLETELLELIFENADFDNIGDATGIQGSTAAGNLEHSLHTGTLGDSSNQNTTEAAYTSYTLWIYGALTASLAVSSGITPEFAAGDLDISIT